jgi:hypothetical protein
VATSEQDANAGTAIDLSPAEASQTHIFRQPDDPSEFVALITDKLNSNLGLQNGFFTSWAQSTAQGSKSAVAGSVNVLALNNRSSAYIDEHAKVNLGAAFDPQLAIVGDTIDLGYVHNFTTGQDVVYRNNGGSDIDGLVDGNTYYVIAIDPTTIQPGHAVWVGEHGQLFEVSHLTQVHFLGELAANRAGKVLVAAEATTGQGPLAPLRIKGPLP